MKKQMKVNDTLTSDVMAQIVGGTGIVRPPERFDFLKTRWGLPKRRNHPWIVY